MRSPIALLSIVLGSLMMRASSAPAQSTGRARISPQGTCHVVALFARFPNEDPQQTTPPDYAQDLFDAKVPGSFTHYYHEMSLGKLTIEGTVLPSSYTSHRSPSGYEVTESQKRKGYFGTFNREVLESADREVDFSRFDNDGDGYVDFLFILVEEKYDGFLAGGAKGADELGLDEDFVTNDPCPSGYIKIDSDLGATQCVTHFGRAVGVMAHEFGHALSLPDLYDRCRQNPEEESAGIGKWGIMGEGSLGWKDQGGAVPFCAWSREKLGWGKIVEITEDTKQVLTDVATTGTIYRIPLGENGSYYLLENRQFSKSHYDRNIPRDGLLIWHIQPYVRNPREPNGDERGKMVDLVCADGLYRDRGYPDGVLPDPDSGRDNLDFWAHDAGYRDAQVGNRGDATDVFDGVQFTALTPYTNPRSEGGVWIERIQRRGTDLIADIQVPTWSGSITRDMTWGGWINVVGDVVVQEGATLTVLAGTTVRFSPRDVLRSGIDPDRCEIDVFGSVKILGLGGPVRFTAEGRGTWAGIRFHEETASMSPSPGLEIRVEDCDHPQGIFWSEHPNANRPELLECIVQDSERGGNGDGAINPGETLRLVLDIRNWTRQPFRVNLSISDPVVADCQMPPFGTVNPGTRGGRSAGFLTVEPDCPDGHRIALHVEFVGFGHGAKNFIERVFLTVRGSKSTEHGSELVTDIGEARGDDSLPLFFALGQNIPNPFNAETVICFDLPHPTDLRLTIFNVVGQTIKQWEGSWRAGHHTLTWRGEDEHGMPVASGVYFYCLQTEQFTQTHATTLLR